MTRTLSMPVLVFAWLAAAGGGVVAQGGGAPSPSLQVVPFWPQPLPNHWVFGSITGVTVDAQDHIWVTHRGADSLEGNEKGMMANPPTSSVCCVAAPFVLQFDADRQARLELRRTRARAISGRSRLAASWSTPRATSGSPPRGWSRRRRQVAGAEAASTLRRLESPRREGPPAGAPQRRRRDLPTRTCSSSRRTGKFLLQIGTPGKMDGPDSQTTLNRPAAVAVDAAANEVYVADSGNRRIVVFDCGDGRVQAPLGRLRREADCAPAAVRTIPTAPPARQFRDVTCIDIAKDGMVYVCDRRATASRCSRRTASS